MAIKMIKIKDLPVNILNPRYVPQESEIDEIKMIIKNGNIEKLMKDIAIYGVDPSENLLVSMDDDGGYIVEEGNRRLTAIKLLNAPELVPDFIEDRLGYINKYNKIIIKYSYRKINEIQCAVVEDEEKLKHFVRLKHTGENGGAGRVGWKTSSKIRFNTDNVFRRYLLDLIQSIVPSGNENYNITTVERIIGDPQMRFFFSIEIDKKLPEIIFKTEEGEEYFNYVIRALSHGLFNVSDLKRKEDRAKFIQKIKEKGIPKTEGTGIEGTETEGTVAEGTGTKGTGTEGTGTEGTGAEGTGTEGTGTEGTGAEGTGTEGTGTEGTGAEGAGTEGTGTEGTGAEGSGTERTEESETERAEFEGGSKRTKRQSEPKGRKYPFQGVNYNGAIPGIASALFELHNIPNIYDYPLTTTTLFRTLFECSIQEYIQKSQVDIKVRDNKNIKDLSIDSLLQTLCNNGNGNFRNLQIQNQLISRILNEANSKKDQDELNVVTHGNYRVASKGALIDIERRWYEIIRIMIEYIS